MKASLPQSLAGMNVKSLTFKGIVKGQVWPCCRESQPLSMGSCGGLGKMVAAVNSKEAQYLKEYFI